MVVKTGEVMLETWGDCRGDLGKFVVRSGEVKESPGDNLMMTGEVVVET